MCLQQGHDFRCVPKSVAVIFHNFLNKDPQKRALVDKLGFGMFSNLPNYYLEQKVLKQIYNCFDTYDNTIHTVAGEVEITTEKIGKALGLNHTGSTYDDKIIPKELSGGGLRCLQKCFLLPTSAPNVTPRALPTLFDLENTRNKNWTFHVHNFLLEEIEKAKKNNAKSVSGCCYALMVIYFHETHFGKNSRDAAAQPPWIQYWTGKTLWKRIKQEKTMAASKKKAKNTSSSSSKSEYIESSHESEFGSDETFSLPKSDSEQTMSDSMVRVERRTRSTKDSVSEMQDGHTLAQAVSSIRKRKNLQREERRQKTEENKEAG
ncbi:hypothetical protein PIB30_054075 [Stylosanthes scabra]|uniref:Uncharacterized protein n=1 Tax=Stylosanthes scabra TaxID=79078 RepID=A0ABU6XJ90_9FABA|nr:hypothetical protein [Stylosanthes scabra]